MKHTRSIAVIPAVAALVFAAAASAGVVIDWHTIDAGGGTSTNGCVSLSGTIGQWDASAALSGSGVVVQPGFWNESVIPPSCPADLTGDGVVNTSDLVRVIGRFGQSGPACLEGDFNGDGVVNTTDLVYFIGRFGVACE